MLRPKRCVQIACAAGVLLAAGSAQASAQANKYTVCKDGTTWMTRGAGVCGRHGGVDPKRSALANQSLNPRLPRDIELARRREFELRMMQGVATSRRIYESNGSVTKVDKDIRKSENAAAKAAKPHPKAGRKP